LLLVLEMVVERALGDAGGCHDFIDRDLGVPSAGEQASGRGEEHRASRLGLLVS
jgi:hypothetical protein